jgi:transketolase
MAQRAIQELGGERHIIVDVAKPEPGTPFHRFNPEPVQLPTYELGTQVATRSAYGDGLKALGDARPDIVAVDGEVSNSTYAEIFNKAHPDRYFEQYICEQQMVSSAVGLGVRGYQPFASTFAAFFSRAYDFIRMAAISRANIKLCGSHAGVSIGEDGPSQMALEDLAMMRAVHGSVVLYPCDPNQTGHLVLAMADHHGISYLRTTREKTPVIYPAGESFTIGGSRVLRRSEQDRITVVAAGITLHETLKAYEQLLAEGIYIRVVDAYSVKPIDVAGLHAAAEATNGRIIVVEDHWMEGGLGDAVLEAFARTPGHETSGQLPEVTKLAVHRMPGSGTPAELLEAAGINAHHIVVTVKKLLG